MAPVEGIPPGAPPGVVVEYPSGNGSDGKVDPGIIG
jgi:hypothetical protein